MIDMPAGGIGELPFASRGDLGLDRRRVTQCALSRICGVCGESLSRPLAFVGTEQEVGRNEFHFPPTHESCAELAVVTWGATRAVLGQAETPEQWWLVTTSGFEYVRPGSEWSDRRAVFAPNSVIEERRLTP
ncbi:MAG TPA: hypothetical protein VFM09_07635 [Marmoricola sp.]|nr:hypothetical protein [Marmoricola sp.]